MGEGKVSCRFYFECNIMYRLVIIEIETLSFSFLKLILYIVNKTSVILGVAYDILR